MKPERVDKLRARLAAGEAGGVGKAEQDVIRRTLREAGYDPEPPPAKRKIPRPPDARPGETPATYQARKSREADEAVRRAASTDAIFESLRRAFKAENIRPPRADGADPFAKYRQEREPWTDYGNPFGWTSRAPGPAPDASGSFADRLRRAREAGGAQADHAAHADAKADDLLNTATGADLDYLGRRVGLDRREFEPDSVYRWRIRYERTRRGQNTTRVFVDDPQLDKLGALLGVPRLLFEGDESYRVRLRDAQARTAGEQRAEHRSQATPCPRCHGRGVEVFGPPGREVTTGRCRACSGTGRDNPARGDVCGDCKGNGYRGGWSPVAGLHGPGDCPDCDTCNGTGRIPRNDPDELARKLRAAPCPKCGAARGFDCEGVPFGTVHAERLDAIKDADQARRER